ncbi:MAG: hypothetical protein AABX39_01670 [Nanoarchaeota archaeon]
MLKNNKAQVSKYTLMFLLYIAATSGVFLVITLIISSIFQSNIDTNGFENRLYSERMAKLIALEQPFDFENYQRQIAFKVNIDDKEFIYNEEFYKRAKPLAPVRYDELEQTFLIKEKKVTVDQVYSNRVKE